MEILQLFLMKQYKFFAEVQNEYDGVGYLSYCQNKTRLKIREDTLMKNFPLYCPKCKQETLINIRKLNVSIIKEPDA